MLNATFWEIFKHCEKVVTWSVVTCVFLSLRIGYIHVPSLFRFNSILEDGSNRWTHAFMLVHVQNINVYTFFAKTLEDKDKWMTAIKTAMDNCFPNQRLASTHEAVMHTFDAPDTTCAHCGKLLKGLFYQGM